MIRWWRVLPVWDTVSRRGWIEEFRAGMWGFLNRILAMKPTLSGSRAEDGHPAAEDSGIDDAMDPADGDMDLIGDEPLRIPVNGILDLHCFRPNETIAVLEEYLNCCVEKGIPVMRVIHGKGKGVQMRRVHSFLKKHPLVRAYGLDGAGPSGWGATIVSLRVKRDDVSAD